MIDADAVRSRLDFASLFGGHVKKLRRGSGGEATGLCPFHEDHSPSLSVNLESGLFKCHACGESGDVFDFFQKLNNVDFPSAVRELGTLAGIVEGTPIRSKVVAKFEYHDAGEKLLYWKERIEPARDGGKKEFLFFHLGTDRKRQPGRGCDPVLYRLPSVLKAKAVLIVEGEAKADLLASWGLPATCLDSGAGSKLSDAMIQHLTGKRIVILPDNDAPGRQYARRLAVALVSRVEMLKVIELPGLPEKGDILDWVRESERRTT